MTPLIIIGSGHAGMTLAREFRKLDSDRPLTIITADDGAGYYKPNISKAYASGKDAEGLIMASAAKQADTLDADLRTLTQVASIDTDRKQIALADGSSLDYHKLVLATGAVTKNIPVRGDAADRIVSVNNRLDYARFRELANGADHITIMGAGLIGCEFANDLSSAGIAVSIVDPLAWPLAQLLPEEAGRALQTGLAQAGVSWHLGHTIAEFNHLESRCCVRLDNGDSITTDLLLSAVGLQPNTALAEAAGLQCQRGIVVDATLACSADGIYALGDCAELDGLVLPYIAPITHAARALAQTLTGNTTTLTLPAMPVIVKTPACPTIISPPPASAAGSWQISGTAPDLECRFEDNGGQLLGCALLGETSKKRMEYQRELPAVFEPA